MPGGTFPDGRESPRPWRWPESSRRLAGLAFWTATAATHLDLDAAQQSPLVFAAGRSLRPGVAIQAVGASLERLQYREVSQTPAQPGEFRRAPGRWEIYLRARDGASRGAMRVRVDVRNARIAEVTDLSGHATAGDTDEADAQLEPELLTGVGETGLERRRPLALGEMSRFIPAAVLAAEDHRFFDHGGLDLFAVGRALVVNASRGEVTQGASTLTQQLVKNLALGPERTWRRKIREGVLALALERQYPKEKILEAYLNTVYLGQRGRAAILGVGAAAQSYWGKDARHLGLAESALLAGMIRAPNRYSPAEHPERAERRRDTVLRRMHDLGMMDGDDPRGGSARSGRACARAPAFLRRLPTSWTTCGRPPPCARARPARGSTRRSIPGSSVRRKPPSPAAWTAWRPRTATFAALRPARGSRPPWWLSTRLRERCEPS